MIGDGTARAGGADRDLFQLAVLLLEQDDIDLIGIAERKRERAAYRLETDKGEHERLPSAGDAGDGDAAIGAGGSSNRRAIDTHIDTGERLLMMRVSDERVIHAPSGVL